jgi:hypothetical protein
MEDCLLRSPCPNVRRTVRAVHSQGGHQRQARRRSQFWSHSSSFGYVSGRPATLTVTPCYSATRASGLPAGDLTVRVRFQSTAPTSQARGPLDLLDAGRGQRRYLQLPRAVRVLHIRISACRRWPMTEASTGRSRSSSSATTGCCRMDLEYGPGNSARILVPGRCRCSCVWEGSRSSL